MSGFVNDKLFIISWCRMVMRVKWGYKCITTSQNKVNNQTYAVYSNLYGKAFLNFD
jgi:hypothetical protein